MVAYKTNQSQLLFEVFLMVHYLIAVVKNPIVSIARDHFQYHKYILHDSYIRSTVQYYMYLYKLNTHKVVEDCPVVFQLSNTFQRCNNIVLFSLFTLTGEIQVQCVQSNVILICNDYYFIQ